MAYSTSAAAVTISPRMNLMAATVQNDSEKAQAAIDRLREEYRKLLGIDEATVKREIDRVISPPNPQAARVPVRASFNLLMAVRRLPVDTRVDCGRPTTIFS